MIAFSLGIISAASVITMVTVMNIASILREIRDKK